MTGFGAGGRGALPMAPVRRRAGALAILALAVITATGTSRGWQPDPASFGRGATVTIRTEALRESRYGSRTVKVRPGDRAEVRETIGLEYGPATAEIRVVVRDGPAKGRTAWGWVSDFAEGFR